MKSIRYYDFVTPQIKLIQEWFKATFGFPINKQSAVCFAIKTTGVVSQGIVYDKIFRLQTDAKTKTTFLPDDLHLKFHQMKSSVFELLQFDNTMALSAIIITRAMTLPDIKEFEIENPKVRRKVRSYRRKLYVQDYIRADILRESVSPH